MLRDGSVAITLARRRSGQHIYCKRRQPMLAVVVSACYVTQGVTSVRSCGSLQNHAGRIARRQARWEVPHAPGAAEIETSQMHDLGIASIGNRCRSQQRLRLRCRDVRQETMKPLSEFKRL